jgi:hypothetical protein
MGQGASRRISPSCPTCWAARGIKNRSGFFFAEFDSLDTFGVNGWVWGLPPGGPHTRKAPVDATSRDWGFLVLAVITYRPIHLAAEGFSRTADLEAADAPSSM